MDNVEYGGFLPLELDERYCEYFLDIGYTENDFVRLDCVRSSFWYAAKCINPTKIYVPYLNCLNSTDPFDELGVPYEFYSLDEKLLPKKINPCKDEAVLWVNYYGNADDYMLDVISSVAKETNMIVDYCHAFFAKPIDNAWNCFSMRKFFGVCDGAYLVKKGIQKIDLDSSFSSENMDFMIKSIEKGTNECYEENIINERRLGHGCKAMSSLTKRLLRTIDYNKIKQLRRSNFLFLHSLIGYLNEFDVNIKSETHMYYPLLITNNELRDRLIGRRLYTPTWWRHVTDYFDNKENIECRYSKYMIMLPIDQRYRGEDMLDIANIVKEELRKCQ